ncbi:MAG: 4-(cytidine 5'-diphospho)-2-C-methyl-D-erythritol kinase [Pseudomonadota bacterium]
MTTVEVFAPAKINLTLHVVGQRSDGYHVLDSLVAFAGVGDRLTLRTPGTGRIEVVGPEADNLVVGSGENLIAKQSAALRDCPDIDCVLEKNLPVSSGIGGGSADAAAFYRGAMHLATPTVRARMELPQTLAAQVAVGADVPMCIKSRPLRVGGTGEELEPIQGIPSLPILLVNPRVPVSTPAVFFGLEDKQNLPMNALPDLQNDPSRLVPWLLRQRNDLQRPAITQAPVIAGVLEAINAQPGCMVARMSGSGATCFGLFNTDRNVEGAALALQRKSPDWWIKATWLNGHMLAMPQVIRATT